MWNRNKRLHTIKKHVYTERKETTHIEVGEEDIHHHIYIKDKHNVCKYGHKTGVQEEEAKRSSYNNKEVTTSPNKMKHNSPFQVNVFFPLTCRILKRNHIFSTISLPFCHDWQEARKLYLRNIKVIKDDQGGTRSPYKCMNVMKQDAMNYKIKERCKTCEKKCMQEDLDRSRSCRAAIEHLSSR